jgi:hypothetical protein
MGCCRFLSLLVLNALNLAATAGQGYLSYFVTVWTLENYSDTPIGNDSAYGFRFGFFWLLAISLWFSTYLSLISQFGIYIAARETENGVCGDTRSKCLCESTGCYFLWMVIAPPILGFICIIIGWIPAAIVPKVNTTDTVYVMCRIALCTFVPFLAPITSIPSIFLSYCSYKIYSQDPNQNAQNQQYQEQHY